MNDKPYRVIVTGSRTWTDENTIRQAIGAIVTSHGPENTVIVHGACPHGADALADAIARSWGGGLTVERWPADWGTHGGSAGFRRNAAMVSRGADICLAFIAPCEGPHHIYQSPHGTHGASHCARLADEAGITVKRWTT